MTEFEKTVRDHTGLPFSKWEHYFRIYGELFDPLRWRGPSLLEIGIDRGGSLQLWKEYFGRGARIIGADIEEKSVEGCECYVADQNDRGSLANLRREVGEVDIIIDDGGHTMEQQINTFETLYGMARKYYIVEDTHTSYWPGWNGGYKKQGTFIEMVKGRLDDMHAYHARGQFDTTVITRTTRSIRVFDSFVVFEKEDQVPKRPMGKR